MKLLSFHFYQHPFLNELAYYARVVTLVEQRHMLQTETLYRARRTRQPVSLTTINTKAHHGQIDAFALI